MSASETREELHAEEAPASQPIAVAVVADEVGRAGSGMVVVEHRVI
jgi:hypothetical protein